MSEVSPESPVIQECPTCGALIDISDEEPMALIHCPTCGAAMRVHKQFGHFELLEILGAGGMGAVYRARDHTLNRSVALKVLRREYSEQPEFLRQFEHEAALTALINHPNVVKVFSTGSGHGLFYIAMELVDKGSLDELMTLQKRVAEPQVLEVGIQIAQGLRAAFQRGLIHRDVKPGNILFVGAHQAKIVDFGLASPIGKNVSVNGEIWGTPYYVAPEKLEQPPQEDFRSDIYSLGATLFHALAGRPPYEADDASMVALKHLKSQPVSIQAFAPHVSASTAYVINRTLNKDPEQRYASYDELVQHLEYARAQLATRRAVPAPGTAAARAAQARRRVVVDDPSSQMALSFVTLFILLALAAGGYYIYQRRADIFGGSEETRSASADAALKAAAQLRPHYDEARQMLIAGKDEEAAAAFRSIEAAPHVPQPLLDWATLHAGLATALAGKLDSAHQDFDKLSKYGPFSEDPFDKEFAAFMTKVGQRMMDDDSIKPADVQKIPRDNYQALALLVYGVKDWEMGEFDDARSLFRDFDDAKPEAPDDWVASYRNFPARYDQSYDKYLVFAEQVRAVGDGEKAKTGLPKIKEALAALDLHGALLRKSQALVRKVQQAADDYDSEQHAMVAEMESQDGKTLLDIKTKADQLAKQFQFREAYALVKGVEVITDKGKADKKNLMARYDWLISFKAQLTQDIGAKAYTGTLKRKSNGQAVTGEISDADDTNVFVKTAGGKIDVPWTDITLDSLLAMARGNLRPDLPEDRQADRKWYAGVYCEFVGEPAKATDLFAEAAKVRPDYQELWKQFPDVPPKK